MSIEQVSLDIMNVNFTINTPSEEIAIMPARNVVHGLLKITLKDDLAIGEFERKITDMNNACQKALARLDQN